MLQLPRNVVSMGVVSFLNDLASDMVFPLIPVFLTSVLGAPLITVGAIEGTADAVANISKIISGRLSDIFRRRKIFAVAGYLLSALAKPMLALAQAPAHVFSVRFLDRLGKGIREAPRDALLSLSIDRSRFARAFGFHRAMDAFGAALGPLIAFMVLPAIDNNLRLLFLLSFVASALAVLVLIVFVKEQQAPLSLTDLSTKALASAEALAKAGGEKATHSFVTAHVFNLGLPFYLFLFGTTVFSLGKASEAFLLLRATDVGVALVMLPIIYFVFNMSATIFSSPFGILADRIGKRVTLIGGYLLFSVLYFFFSLPLGAGVWMLFFFYGIYYAATDGVARAIVADIVPRDVRGTAYGLFHGLNGFALLPASLVFGYLAQHFGYDASFTYGAILAFLGALILIGERLLASKNR